ncbi:MAG: DUF6790 family protein [Methanomassiliicoccales archaeon]
MVLRQPTDKPAKILSLLGVAITGIGTFLGIFFAFHDVYLAVRIVTALLVGAVGILGFLRHSVWWHSDQVRLGWHQENPQFQFEVGFANLAMAIPALLASFLSWGILACGMMLLTYGLYMLCALGLHIRETLKMRAGAKRPMMRLTTTAIMIVVLLAFAVMALNQAGVA